MAPNILKGSGAFIFKESVQEEVQKSTLLGLLETEALMISQDVKNHSLINIA